jgi:hypothetical protein
MALDTLKRYCSGIFNLPFGSFLTNADLIVTCFPQRWNPGKDNSFAVLEGIIDDIHRSSRWPPASSVHELASVITKRCSGLFYEDHHDEDYQFLDMFESSISDLVCHVFPLLRLSTLS